MPITAKLSRQFYERFGDEVTNELVNWLNAVDDSYRTEFRELFESHFGRLEALSLRQAVELRAEFRAGLDALGTALRQDVSALEARVAALEARQASFEAHVDARFSALEAHFDARFAAVEARFSASEAHFDARFAAVEARFSASEAYFDARFAASEAYVDARLAPLATREHVRAAVAESQTRLIRWMVGLTIGSVASNIGIIALLVRLGWL